MQTTFFSALILIFSLGSSLAYAEATVIDPKNLLGFLEMKHKISFEQAFPCEQKKDFFIQTGKCQFSCDENLCKDNCLTAPMPTAGVMQIDDCTADAVQIYSSKGQAFSIQKADYESASHSTALTLIKQLDYFYEPIYQIKIIQVKNKMGGKLIDSGKLYPTPTIEILFEVYPNEIPVGSAVYSAPLFAIELDPNRVGLDQFMYLHSAMDFGPKSSYIIKRKGFMNAIF